MITGYDLFTGVGGGGCDHKEQFQTKSKNAQNDLLEQADKPSKAKSEVKKTWGFRRSTVAKREMPVEAATDSPENRLPVRRSGRQPKRTDKLEEFLSTAKRGSRKSAPPSVESGDPPSQTPTDAETASEASFDGNADSKAAEDKAESPERRTRSSVKKQAQKRTQVGRQTRSGGRTALRDEGSSDNEEDGKDAVNKNQLQGKVEEKIDDKSDPISEDGGSINVAQTQSEQDSGKVEVPEEEKNEPGTKDDKTEESDEDGIERPGSLMVKREPIRTYVNKKKAVKKNTTPVKAPVNKNTIFVKKETKPKVTKAAGKMSKPQMQEEDDNDSSTSSSSSSSSSSIESDDGGYDPNALYCICRQKHNKRYVFVGKMCLNLSMSLSLNLSKRD